MSHSVINKCKTLIFSLTIFVIFASGSKHIWSITKIMKVLITSLDKLEWWTTFLNIDYCFFFFLIYSLHFNLLVQNNLLQLKSFTVPFWDLPLICGTSNFIHIDRKINYLIIIKRNHIFIDFLGIMIFHIHCIRVNNIA